jgi:hypothetical protein
LLDQLVAFKDPWGCLEAGALADAANLVNT